MTRNFEKLNILCFIMKSEGLPKILFFPPQVVNCDAQFGIAGVMFGL